MGNSTLLSCSNNSLYRGFPLKEKEAYGGVLIALLDGTYLGNRFGGETHCLEESLEWIPYRRLYAETALQPLHRFKIVRKEINQSDVPLGFPQLSDELIGLVLPLHDFAVDENR